MLGILPRPLAASLYRNLITSHVWSAARQRMGYREIQCAELMLLIMGRPYIDVRASFNSFLPAGLDEVTCKALVSAWLDRLENMPQLHDKVEFEIAQTVLDFCFDQHLNERYPGLLTTERRIAFRESLCKLTQRNLDITAEGSLNQAMEAVIELRNRQAGRALANQKNPLPLSAINLLLAECRKFGTLPFSILARHAFMAESLLRTAVKRGALSNERLADFKLSISTISGELSREFLEVCVGHRDPKNFLQKYGHLRPGTYDILSPRYLDRENLFVDTDILNEENVEPFSLSQNEKGNINALLAENKLLITADELLTYARKAIAGRELAKFIFSRNLSDIIETIAYWGESLGLSRDDVSYIDLAAILDQNMRVVTENPSQWFANHINLNKGMHEKAGLLKLGYLIRSVRDVYVAPQHRAAPNFIGTKKVMGNVAKLEAGTSCGIDLHGRIVCIENADPGFDWIFTRDIGGLVTKFGGANSHMAIRCAEYGLPAAIGVGEQMFEMVASASKALLDPAAVMLKAQ